MGQRQSQICPTFKSSQEIREDLQRRFIICPHPIYSNRQDFKLLHERLTNKRFMLRIITADELQKNAIENRILRRLAYNNCTLTKLSHYIFEKSQSYCSKQFKIYLLFDLQSGVTLRQQILAQGKSRMFFSQIELVIGLQDLIKNLLQIRYLKQKHGNINTHQIYYQEGKMILSDPLLCPEGQEFPEKYPSPEKLQKMANRIEECNYYQSDVFSIVMCILEAVPTVKLNGIYKRNYTLNQKNLFEQIQKSRTFPKLYFLFQNLLFNPDNQLNRRRYLQLFTSKSNHLFPDLTSSASSLKSGKVHNLGGYNYKHQKETTNHLNIFSKLNIQKQQSIKGLDDPQKLQQFKNYYQKQNSNNQTQNNSYAPKITFKFANPIRIEQIPASRTLKRVDFVSNIEADHFHIPHHLYKFTTNPYIARKPESLANQGFSRSSSEYSVKSQLVVYEPSKSILNLQLVSPREPSIISNQENNFTIKEKQSNQIRKQLNFENIEDKKNKNNFVLINSTIRQTQSISFKSNKQIDNQKQQVSQYRQNNQQLHDPTDFSSFATSIENLPLKLSMLVKNKIDSEDQEKIYKQINENSTIQRCQQSKIDEKMVEIFSKNFINRTIPQQQVEQQESFQCQKPNKGNYKIEYYQNGSRYNGQMKDGMRDGRGTFYYKDGGFYQGQWKNNLMNGSGKLYYDNNMLAYEGQWYNDEFHGKGKVYNDAWQTSEQGINFDNFQSVEGYWIQYDGELSHDYKQGLGKWRFSNGQYYEGYFEQDLPSGKGIFYSLKGSIKGIWQSGRLVRRL